MRLKEEVVKVPLNPKDLRNMDIKELKEKLNQLQMDLLRYRVEARMGTLKNTAVIRNTRKDIARILTVLKEKESRSGGKK
jgi:large subunit ribosomal protein L29